MLRPRFEFWTIITSNLCVINHQKISIKRAFNWYQIQIEITFQDRILRVVILIPLERGLLCG